MADGMNLRQIREHLKLRDIPFNKQRFYLETIIQEQKLLNPRTRKFVKILISRLPPAYHYSWCEGTPYKEYGLVGEYGKYNYDSGGSNSKGGPD